MIVCGPRFFPILRRGDCFYLSHLFICRFLQFSWIEQRGLNILVRSFAWATCFTGSVLVSECIKTSGILWPSAGSNHNTSIFSPQNIKLAYVVTCYFFFIWNIWRLELPDINGRLKLRDGPLSVFYGVMGELQKKKLYKWRGARIVKKSSKWENYCSPKKIHAQPENNKK